MTREMGKPLAETRGDVQEGIDTAYYAATEGRRLFGHTVPSELRNKWAMSFRRPIGVAGIITPFNFPLAIPTWKMFPALVCGNACVFKPAEDVPHTGDGARRDPARGRPAARSDPARARPRRDGRCGDRRASRRSGRSRSPDRPRPGGIVGETCGRMHKRLSLEMGGKNAQIVLDDADLDLALDGVLWGAFGTTGQRCTATSRLILQRGIHDDFLGAARRSGDGRCGSATAGRRGPTSGRSSTRRRARRSSGTSTSGRRRARISLCGGRRAAGHGARARVLLRADDLRARASRACGSSRRRSSGRCCRVIRVADRRRGVRA